MLACPLSKGYILLTQFWPHCFLLVDCTPILTVPQKGPSSLQSVLSKHAFFHLCSLEREHLFTHGSASSGS